MKRLLTRIRARARVIRAWIVERDAAYDQTDRTAVATDCASDSLSRGVA